MPIAVQINLFPMHDADTKAALLEGLPEWMLFAFCNPDAVYFTAFARCGHSKVKNLKIKETKPDLVEMFSHKSFIQVETFVS